MKWSVFYEIASGRNTGVSGGSFGGEKRRGVWTNHSPREHDSLSGIIYNLSTVFFSTGTIFCCEGNGEEAHSHSPKATEAALADLSAKLQSQDAKPRCKARITRRRKPRSKPGRWRPANSSPGARSIASITPWPARSFASSNAP